MEKIAAFLGSKRLYHALLALTGVSLVLVQWFWWNAEGVDQYSYVGLANGILHHHFSQWWDMPVPIPDTFRTPGYPLYIAAALALFGTWRALALVQLVMYLVSLHLTFRTMERYVAGYVPRNVLLLLLLPSVNVTTLAFVVSPEIPVMFCLSVLLWADPMRKRTHWFAAVGLGLIAGFIFQCRPVFLLFPFVRLIMDLWFRRNDLVWRTHSLVIGTFILTLLPFGFWNKAHHGVFKVTPLESGAGVFNLGYWAGRIPDYEERRYFWNFTADEMVRFVPKDSVPVEIAAYNMEWDRIDSEAAHALTKGDSLMIVIAKRSSDRTFTFNSQYVLAREKAVMRQTWRDIAQHPLYYLTFKAYSAVRLWVVGVDRTRFEEGGMIERSKLVMPFLFSLVTFLAMMILVPLAHRVGGLALKDTYPMVILLVYWGLIHVPFTIQTRYTTSLRMVMYGLIGMAISVLLQRHRKPKAPSSWVAP
ncbi:MAG: hypothetical protein IPO90_05520 [Flavobacteriales bacterium]|nr:hypothetical protein [Flavobacteriales bacterium]